VGDSSAVGHDPATVELISTEAAAGHLPVELLSSSAEPEVLQDREDRVVLRIGETVRHPREAWTESVHALLEYLRANGFDQAPAPMGMSGEHEEISFIEGDSGDEACRLVATDEAVAAVAQLLRRYHDTVAAWQPEIPPVWYDGQVGTGTGDQLVCHGDVGPWNLVWRDGRLVGLIDWEYATVGTRRTDIAYALHYLAPFRDRTYWEGILGLRRRPRRRHRMAVFAEAYGIAVDDDLIDEVIDSQQAGVQMMITLAERGRLRQRQLIEAGELERERQAVVWTADRRHKFLPSSR
jgi:Phosphotransferase enzyme family